MDSITPGQMPVQRADEAQAPSAIDVHAQLASILVALDDSGESLAATYVQMALDVLCNSNSGANA